MKILLVEDEALIALDMEDLLSAEGHDVVGPAGTVDQALDLVSKSDAIDLALLDLNLRGVPAYPVAEALDARRIPFVFLSGYGHHGLDPRFSSRRILTKPVDRRLLFSVIETAVHQSNP